MLLTLKRFVFLIIKSIRLLRTPINNGFYGHYNGFYGQIKLTNKKKTKNAKKICG
uniref:Uncharacterized protein n=1 Tax=Arsenophonus nasoniae TaxID=638 RepID=D2U3S2_9GAMM|nr:hypothetical protein ARN_33090 [Arsenophonus nasoniae]